MWVSKDNIKNKNNNTVTNDNNKYKLVKLLVIKKYCIDQIYKEDNDLEINTLRFQVEITYIYR